MAKSKKLDSDNSSLQVKDQVAASFGSKARAYNMYAHVQRQAAQRFAELAEEFTDSLQSPYLEIGCGTGFVTQPMVSLLPGGEFTAADLSVEMLQACQADLNIPERLQVHFSNIDGENQLPDDTYGLIFTALTAQWFADTEAVLNQYLRALKPAGMLMYSYLDERCFPEWKALCAETGIPFTGNTLPPCAPIPLDPSLYSWEFFSMELFTEVFDSPADFFRNLKRIGAGTQRSGQRNSPGSVLQLDEHWKQKNRKSFHVTYGITFGGIRKK
ncbi:MAG: malonyl-CoA O-methyltransferase BioC [Bacteroidetes bacterium HLUCCA01]|nr:MAG: malonyl-CoA O-methyltransferase BioC [Bacteroidetes bacterium HLUCCA01]